MSQTPPIPSITLPIPSAVPYPLLSQREGCTYRPDDFVQALAGQLAQADLHLLHSQAEQQLPHLFSATDFHAAFQTILSMTVSAPLLPLIEIAQRLQKLQQGKGLRRRW